MVSTTWHPGVMCASWRTRKFLLALDHWIPFDGIVTEILAIDGSLSEHEREKLKSYASLRYNIACGS
jgi:hypothetical protein